MRITMIGHSTLLLEGAGTRLLTDPYFGRHGHVAYARVAPPSLRREEIGELDGVLASHAHWDHTDRAFLRALDPRTPVAIPAGTSLLFRLKGARNILPLKPWASRAIGEALITAVPATHIARSVGYVIEAGGITVYFAGDTYYRPFMADIGNRFRIDVAMMPVTTFLIPPTMGERGAVAATRDLRPRIVIPIHRGVTPRSRLLRGWQSVERFETRLRAARIDAEVIPLREGESWTNESAVCVGTAS